MAQERLDRITQYVSEMALTGSVPMRVAEQDQLDDNLDSPNRQSLKNWMDCAIPADSVLGLTSSSSGADREVPFCCGQLEPHSPDSPSLTENLDFSHVRELERESRRSWGHFDDYSSATSGSRSDSFERPNGSIDLGQTSPRVGYISTGHRRAESLESIYRCHKAPNSVSTGYVISIILFNFILKKLLFSPFILIFLYCDAKVSDKLDLKYDA